MQGTLSVKNITNWRAGGRQEQGPGGWRTAHAPAGTALATRQQDQPSLHSTPPHPLYFPARPPTMGPCFTRNSSSSSAL